MFLQKILLVYAAQSENCRNHHLDLLSQLFYDVTANLNELLLHFCSTKKKKKKKRAGSHICPFTVILS